MNHPIALNCLHCLGSHPRTAVSCRCHEMGGQHPPCPLLEAARRHADAQGANAPASTIWMHLWMDHAAFQPDGRIGQPPAGTTVATLRADHLAVHLDGRIPSDRCLAGWHEDTADPCTDCLGCRCHVTAHTRYGWHPLAGVDRWELSIVSPGSYAWQDAWQPITRGESEATIRAASYSRDGLTWLVEHVTEAGGRELVGRYRGGGPC